MFSLEFLVDTRCESHDEPRMVRFRVVVGDYEVRAYARFEDVLGEAVWGRVLADELHGDGRRSVAPLMEARIIALAFQRYHNLAELGLGPPMGTTLNGTSIFDLGTAKREP